MKSKKILIFIIVILATVILVNLTLLIWRKNNDLISDSNNYSLAKAKIENIEESIENNTEQEENTLNDVDNKMQKEEKELPKITEELKNDEKENQDTKITETIEQKNVSKSETQKKANTAITSNTKTQVEKENSSKKTKQSMVNETQNVAEKKQETTKQAVTKKQPSTPSASSKPTIENKFTTQSTTNKTTEKYKVNQSLINKIKSIINSNPSSLMKEFGYNIVIDSSIVNKTTGFTFTEKRVKNGISGSFGTIRIYARNYYKNNQLMWNECFIL